MCRDGEESAGRGCRARVGDGGRRTTSKPRSYSGPFRCREGRYCLENLHEQEAGFNSSNLYKGVRMIVGVLLVAVPLPL